MKRYKYAFLATMLLLSIILSSTAMAIDRPLYAPMSSNYLSNYGAYLTATGNGNMDIDFTVTGTGIMDEIGSTQIRLYRYVSGAWVLLKTYSYTQPQYSYIMGYDDFSYAETVDYSGMSGQQYYASVTVYAGIDGIGDSRIVNSNTIYA